MRVNNTLEITLHSVYRKWESVFILEMDALKNNDLHKSRYYEGQRHVFEFYLRSMNFTTDEIDQRKREIKFANRDFK